MVFENQAMIDKTVIFMNNVAATQELAARNEAMWENVSSLSSRATGVKQ